MRFSPSIEHELTAAANSADRSNRPTLLVVVPALLLIGVLVLVLVANHRFTLAKRVLRDRLAERADVAQWIEYADELERAHPEISDLFPPNAYMGVNIEDVKKEIWGDEDSVNVGVKSNPRSAGLARDVMRSDVDVSFQVPMPVDEVFLFIHRVLEDPKLKGRVFLARMSITPRAGGWMGSVKFRLYEKAQ